MQPSMTSASPLEDRPLTRSRSKTILDDAVQVIPDPSNGSQLPKKRAPSARRVRTRARIKRRKMSPSPSPSPLSSPMSSPFKKTSTSPGLVIKEGLHVVVDVSSDKEEENVQTVQTPQTEDTDVKQANPNPQSAVPDTILEETEITQKDQHPQDMETQKDSTKDSTVSTDSTKGSQIRIPITDDFTDLNSSPIKKSSQTSFLSSSPSRQAKRVVFSDILTSDVPFLPEDGTTTPVCITATPKRPILKAADEIPSSPLIIRETPFTKQNFKPESVSFWSKGNIIQLPPGSPLMAKLISGCITVLKNKSFNKRFEVYASFNHNFKINTSEFNQTVLLPNLKTSPSKKGQFKNYVSILSGFVQRDVLSIESSLDLDGEEKENAIASGKNDPFCTRTISQALKMIGYFMTDGDLNNHISVEDSQWFYIHASQVIIKPKVSKTMVAPYLGIIKECKFTQKKKRLIFNSVNSIDIPEHMLFAVLNMRGFASASLAAEKFAAIRNFVQNFPLMMVNNFKHWFEVFLMNLCDIGNPFYSKTINSGIISLLDIARVYIRNKEVNFMANQCLEKRVSNSFKSFSVEEEVALFDQSINAINYDVILQTLEGLADSKRYKAAVDIWVGISLLCGNKDKGFERWGKIDSWINTLFSIISVRDPAAQVAGIWGWKAVVFHLCAQDLGDLNRYVNSRDLVFGEQGYEISERLQNKFDLLLVIFKTVDTTVLSQEALFALNGVVSTIFYCLLNQQSGRTNKFYDIYWDKAIAPIFQLFHFNTSTRVKSVLPMGVRTLLRLTKREPIDTSNFHSLRCLSNEGTTISEINSIDNKWVQKNGNRVLAVAQMVLFRKDVRPGFKFSLLNILNDLYDDDMLKETPLTQRAVQIKAVVHDIIVETFDGVHLDPDGVAKLFRFATSLFGLFNMTSVDGLQDNSGDMLGFIMNIMATFHENQKDTTISKLLEQIEPSKSFFLIAYLVKFNLIDQESTLIQERLKGCKADVTSDIEMKIVGMLFEVLFVNYSSFTKSTVQSMVLLDETRLTDTVNKVALQRWTLPIFKFYLLLVEPAPQSTVKRISLKYTLQKFEKEQTFLEMVDFLFDHSEIDLKELRGSMMQRFQGLSVNGKEVFRELWEKYLSGLEGEVLEENVRLGLENGIKSGKEEQVPEEQLQEQTESQAEKQSFDIEMADATETEATEAGATEAEPESNVPPLHDPITANTIIPPAFVNTLPPIPRSNGKENHDDGSSSDSDSDAQNNTFSSETGNDSDANESFMATEKELSSEDSVKDLEPILQVPASLAKEKGEKDIGSFLEAITVDTAETHNERTNNNLGDKNDQTNPVDSTISEINHPQHLINKLQHLITNINEPTIKSIPKHQQEQLELQLLTLLLNIKQIKTQPQPQS